MAGEMLTFNPRRKSRRKRARRAHAKKATRRRRRRVASANPSRRRRRSTHRRAHARRRRVHRNPRIPFLGDVNVSGIVVGGLGYFGTRLGAGWAQTLVPNTGLDPNLVRIGTKAVVGLVALPMLAKLVGFGRYAKMLALGGGIAVVTDALDTFVVPSLPAGLKLADYDVRTLTDYDVRTLSATGDGSGAYGGSAYGGTGF